MSKSTSNMIKDIIKLRNSITFAAYFVMMNIRKSKVSNKVKL